MLAPLFASMASALVLSEPFRLWPEGTHTLPEHSFRCAFVNSHNVPPLKCSCYPLVWAGIATCVSLAGVALVAKPSFLFGSDLAAAAENNARGVVYGLIASVSAGIAYMFVRMLGTTAKMPWMHVCFSQALAQIILSIPAGLIAGQTFDFGMSLRHYVILISASLIGGWSQVAMTIGMV